MSTSKDGDFGGESQFESALRIGHLFFVRALTSLMLVTKTLVE